MPQCQLPCKADVAAAKDDGRSEHEDEPDDDHGDDSDGSSHFGLESEDKPARAKGKAQPKPKAQPSKGQRNSEKGGLDKHKAALAEATSLMGTLASLTPSSLLKGAFKDADVTARLRKVSQSASGLAQQASFLEDSELKLKQEMEGLSSRMEKRVEGLDLLHDIHCQTRSCKNMVPLLKDDGMVQKLVRACRLMDGETLSGFLLFLASKVSEARGVS